MMKNEIENIVRSVGIAALQDKKYTGISLTKFNKFYSTNLV